MPDHHSPATAKRMLRRQLRWLRENANLSTKEVADRFRWSVSKLIRIENGSVAVSVPDVMALSTLYAVANQTRDDLIAWAVAAKQPSWWDEHRRVVPPQLQQLLGFEADATRIRLFEPTMIPALLQVERYAQQIGPLTLEPKEKPEADELIAVRLKRQQHVLFGDSPPEYTALIDESVLRRRVGGPEVMAEQLSHLTKLVNDGTIALGILPYSHSAYIGVEGGFHLMEFDDSRQDAVLYLELAHTVVALQDKPDLIAQYGERFERMMNVSHCGADAVRFIADVQASTWT